MKQDKGRQVVLLDKTNYVEKIFQLPLRPIVSKIGTASFYLAKHLARIIVPLSKSETLSKILKILSVSLNHLTIN